MRLLNISVYYDNFLTFCPIWLKNSLQYLEYKESEKIKKKIGKVTFQDLIFKAFKD